MRHSARLLQRQIVVVLLLALTAFAVLPAAAQDTAVNPNANILFPPAVYTVAGEFPIIGTANAQGMTNYFLEFRPVPESEINPPAGGSATQTPTFFPAVLPSNTAVTGGLLGMWDTTLIPDGLYELRLTVNVSGSSPIVVLSGPLRVHNTPDPVLEAIFTALGIPFPGGSSAAPTPVPDVPTALPTATIVPTNDPTPRGTVTTATANVRTGDGTNFPAITALQQDTVVTLVGISNQGSGWYQVQMPNGGLGWMSPTVLNVTGEVSRLPRIQPPPPPITPTFTPIPATATPITSANLVAGIVVTSPAPPVCAQTFNVGFDVANLGSQPTAFSGTVSLVDTHAATGTVQGSTIGGFPVLQPGQTFRVDMPLTISTYFNEEHILTLTIDPQGVIPETTRADNVQTHRYTLAQGGCS
ncbi:MAG: SH3 domain-containing protein [Anaerolineae bacterium]|nr:SH3 domain-containing protein [Anaerolineae bacterium]